MTFDLDRFTRAQDGANCFVHAIGELNAGAKRSHWIWFVFPQLAGLGSSPMAEMYGLHGVDEATAYLRDRTLRDRLLIRRGLAAIDRAERLGLRQAQAAARGPYLLQASIAACHARALEGKDTDWARIVALYDELRDVSPSPIVDLNRAVAVGMASGPQAGLDALDHLLDEPSLRGYHLLPSVRGDLLVKVGRTDEARKEFERAASLTRNERERELLLARAAAITRQA